MKLVLVDLKPQVCAAWRAAFGDVADATVHEGPFQAIIGTFDCFVSPANSFGMMDGGIDAAIIDFFGYALQDRVQDAIWQQYRGEQPVGTCLLVPTENPRCPWLAHCPTMRVPADVSWTNNAYQAMLAALTAAGNAGVAMLGSPGLGTQVGQMPAEVAARQMRYAFDLWSGPRMPVDWSHPGEREWRSSGRSRQEYLQHKYSPKH